jgi:hypothetical protein
MNGPRVLCIACAKHIGPDDEYTSNGPAFAVLEQLVELKRMKDTGGATPEYERQKAIAWREAFRVCGVVGEPKP